MKKKEVERHPELRFSQITEYLFGEVDFYDESELTYKELKEVIKLMKAVGKAKL